MDPKSQHTIPRLHLQHFAGSDPAGQVWTYDALAARQWSAIPENTCVQTHFYSAERADGTMDTRLEEILAKVEGRAAPVYMELLNGRLPQDQQARLDFAQFLALMYTRTTAMRRMAGEIVGRTTQILSYANACNPAAFDAMTRRYEAEKGETLDPEVKENARQAMLDPTSYMIEVSKESTFVALSASDKLSLTLYKMKWTVAEANHGYFITSDNPLVRVVDPRTWHPIYGDYGFMNKTATVTIPLSPKVLLALSWNKSAREVGALERNVVHQLNDVRAAYADRYLFAHLNDKRIVRLAEAYKNSHPSMTTEGFGPEEFAPVKVARRSKSRQ